MVDQNEKPMVVQVSVDGKRVCSITLTQDDPNPNQRSGSTAIDECDVYVLVSGAEDGSDTNVYLSFTVKEESEEEPFEHEVSVSERVDGLWDWKSLNWSLELPVRPNFPGEAPLPRTTLNVTLELEEALVPA